MHFLADFFVDDLKTFFYLLLLLLLGVLFGDAFLVFEEDFFLEGRFGVGGLRFLTGLDGVFGLGLFDEDRDLFVFLVGFLFTGALTLLFFLETDLFFFDPTDFDLFTFFTTFFDLDLLLTTFFFVL